MAARKVLASSTFSHSFLSNPSPSFNSSSHAVSFSLPRRTFPFTLAAPQNPLVAAKEAASALDLTQDYEGQEETMVFDNEILLSDVEPDDELGPVAAVPKKRTSKSKKNIRKNVWKRKGAVAAMKAYSLAKSILTGKSTSFMTDSSKKDT